MYAEDFLCPIPHTPWLGLGKQTDKSKFENIIRILF